MTTPDAAAPEPPGAGAAASDVVLERVVREESGRIVAALTSWIGNLDIAEEAVADAVVEALREWRSRGIPPRPGGWLMQAARHNALDRLRRETRYREKLSILAEPAPTASTTSHGRSTSGSRCCSGAVTPLFRPTRSLR
jgi:predicted RNA polymerase sigma factor